MELDIEAGRIQNIKRGSG